MSIDSIDTLLDVLCRAQLLSQEQADEVIRELVPHCPDPERLGERLVEVDWLTAYQLQLLLAGQWDDLQIGSYQVLEKIGEGGASEVYKAWDTIHGRHVALKVLRRCSDELLDEHSQLTDPLRREAEAILRLSHPNVVKTHEIQWEGGAHYFAMEHLEGMTLERYVREVGPLDIDHACEYVRQVAQALQYVYQLGLVHRGIQPANLLLTHPPLPPAPGLPARRGPDPVVKILDWGLARCVTDKKDGEERASEEEPEREQNTLIGSGDYVAPEQAINPQLVDVRADIYGLGCTLYYLLAGQPPFPGSSVAQRLRHHKESPAPSLKAARPEVPDELDALIKRMLAKSPAERFSIPLLLVTPLRRFMAGGFNLGRTGGLNTPSWSRLPRPAAPGTTPNLPRPGTQPQLQRPATHAALPRPGTNGSSNGSNGNNGNTGSTNGKPQSHR